MFDHLFFLLSLDFFTSIGLLDEDPPIISSSSSKFKENEDKPGDSCVAESEAEFVSPKPQEFDTFLADVSLNFSKFLIIFYT